jgi:hypothetical protein
MSRGKPLPVGPTAIERCELATDRRDRAREIRGRGIFLCRALPGVSACDFLSNRPELGNVSRGEVVSINNYYRLLTPVRLDSLRLLLTSYPQEEFNPTDDRKSRGPPITIDSAVQTAPMPVEVQLP